MRPWCLALLLPAAASAQVSTFAEPTSRACASSATAGSAAERTFVAFALADSGFVSTVLRPLSHQQLKKLESSLNSRTATEANRCNAREWSFRLQGWLNSSAANAANDGGVWQGRGVTVAASGGITARRGPVALTLRPLAFITQNAAYDPRPLGALGSGDFRDPRNGDAIDLPYRFGSESFARLTPGESGLRVEWRELSGGITAESQQWGPAHYYPLVLGTEGPGYPRAFVEARSIPVRIGTAGFQWHTGILRTSPYATAPYADSSRIASGIIARFTPRGLNGLEVGGARFFHARGSLSSLGWSEISLPVSGILRSQGGDFSGGNNQVASLFLRVAPPGRGIEVYGEYYRDDYSEHFRDLIAEIDHTSAYMLGVRRVRASEGRLNVLILERASGRATDLHRLIPQAPPYTHSTLREGHTHLGQPLGSLAVLRGGATTMAWQDIRVTTSRRVRLELMDPTPGAVDQTAAGKLLLALEAGYQWLGKRGERGTWVRAQLGQDGTIGSNLTLGLSWSPR